MCFNKSSKTNTLQLTDVRHSQRQRRERAPKTELLDTTHSKYHHQAGQNVIYESNQFKVCCAQFALDAQTPCFETKTSQHT